MAREEKPYRVYRGGRVRGGVPLRTKPAPRDSTDGGEGRSRYRGPSKPARERKRWGWGRRIGVGFAALVLLFVIWSIAGYLPFSGVVTVDFGSFKQLIDDVGGVDINVPENILSNRFDCPYASQARCARWPGWRFHKGTQHMNGQRALIYSRIRENRLNPSESDVTRAERQQRVVQATLHKLSSFSTFLSAPFKAGKYMRPLSTDLSAWQLVQLGWG